MVDFEVARRRGKGDAQFQVPAAQPGIQVGAVARAQPGPVGPALRFVRPQAGPDLHLHRIERNVAQPGKPQFAEFGRKTEIEPPGFKAAGPGSREIQQRETGRVVPQHEKPVRRAGQRGQPVQLGGGAPGKCKAGAFLEIPSQHLALVAPGDEQLVAAPGEAIEGCAAAGKENLRKPIRGKEHDGTAAVEAGRLRPDRLGRRTFRGKPGAENGGGGRGGLDRRARDAAFPGNARIHEAGEQIPVGLGQEIGDLGFAVFLQNHGHPAAGGKGIKVSLGG